MAPWQRADVCPRRTGKPKPRNLEIPCVCPGRISQEASVLYYPSTRWCYLVVGRMDHHDNNDDASLRHRQWKRKVVSTRYTNRFADCFRVVAVPSVATQSLTQEPRLGPLDNGGFMCARKRPSAPRSNEGLASMLPSP